MMSIDSIIPSHVCALFEGDCRCLCACCRGVCNDQTEHTVDSQHMPAMCEQSRWAFTGEQPVYHLFSEPVEVGQVELSEPAADPTEDETDEGAPVETPDPDPEPTPEPTPDPTVMDNRPKASRTPRQPSAS